LNAFQRIINAFAYRAISWWSDKLSFGGLVSSGTMANSGVLVTPERALALTPYFAAIDRISTDVASLPLQVFRRRKSGGRDEVRDHPVAELLAYSPDGETTSMRWRQAVMGHTLGWGNGYAEIEFDRGGRPLGLYHLDPSTTAPDRRPQDRKLFYRTGAQTIPPARVLHFAGFGFDGLRGYSRAQVAREAIGLGLGAERYGSGFFGNSAIPSGVIEVPHKLKDKLAVDELRRGWEANYGGADNARKTAVLEQGAKFTPFPISNEDAQFLLTRQFQVVEVARLFGIPPHKIGDYSQTGSAYRALEESNLDYMITTIRPWCEQVEQELNRKLFTKAERAQGVYCCHDMTEFLRGDSKARGVMYEALFGLSVLTPNDVREQEGLNPIGPDGDHRFVSNQFTPLEKALAPTPPPPDNAPPPAPAKAAPAAPKGSVEGNGQPLKAGAST
jgi:HK97 family phage portal protein